MTASLIVHAVLIFLAGTVTLFRMPQSSYAPTYMVDLVSLPPAPVSKGAEKKPVAPASRPVEKKAAEVPVKRSAPKEGQVTVRIRETMVGDEAARAQRKKRLDELEKEASRLFDSYTSDEAARPGERQVAPSHEPAADGGIEGLRGAVTGRGGAPVDLRFKSYYDRIWNRIRASWALPAGVAAAEDRLLTVVGIRIASTGEIVDHWTEKASGNIYYDQSALRAVRKASPLPPLPADLGEDFLEVGINFRVLE